MINSLGFIDLSVLNQTSTDLFCVSEDHEGIDSIDFLVHSISIDV
jgi:hypothetical protein